MMRFVISSIFLLLFSVQVSAVELILCPKGKVNYGDKYDSVQKKCPQKGGMGSSRRYLNEKIYEFRYFESNFDDGSKATFIFLDDALFFVVVS